MPATMRVATAAVAAVCLLSGSASAGPLSRLGGAWAGEGSIVTVTGPQHARCTADYGVTGAAATLDLRCATESYALDLTASVTEARGRVAGTWAERRFGTSGAVSGRADAGRLTLDTLVLGTRVSIVIGMGPARQTVTLRTTSLLLPAGDLVLVRRR